MEKECAELDADGSCLGGHGGALTSSNQTVEGL